MRPHNEDPDAEIFEAQLQAALRREPAPPDFAAKVLARAAAQDRQREKAAPRQVYAVPVWRRPAAWALAAGLAIAAVIPSAVSEYQRRRELRAFEARRELLLALSITRAKLQQTKERIQRNTRHIL